MKKSILAAILCCFTLASALAQTNEKTSAVHVSFIPPLSTHGSQAAEYTNGVSFNILAGVSKNEKYFTFGGLANIIHNNASGVQFAGLLNTIGNDANGFQFAGLFNRTGNTTRGIQFAGLYNLADNGYGFQFGGLANTIKKEYSGIQFAGLFNSAKDFQGFQFAGLVNIAKNVKGVQFAGLVNIAENSDYPIGLINIIKNGEMSVGVTYDETGSVIASFRSGGRVLYGILGVGYNHKSNHKHYVAEGGFGAHIPVVNRFRINAELKSQFMNMSSSDEFLNKSSFSILPAFKFTPNLEIFAGPSINYMNTDDVSNKNMFPGGDIWTKFKDDRLQQLHIGYTAGIQWIF
ncbi:hypothetical protein [Bacteroides sp. 519]|uniref:hypothetical protein n=1 Tax=Bacteroides sp. 519 TaxID=2302937 RepID=UPI0013D59148|nr:hypothetical protein [Bacteroides sp. 519]NDV59611.1 hypothetical protein [Bacteroides sp. 519]